MIVSVENKKLLLLLQAIWPEAAHPGDLWGPGEESNVLPLMGCGPAQPDTGYILVNPKLHILHPCLSHMLDLK